MFDITNRKVGNNGDVSNDNNEDDDYGHDVITHISESTAAPKEAGQGLLICPACGCPELQHLLLKLDLPVCGETCTSISSPQQVRWFNAEHARG